MNILKSLPLSPEDWERAKSKLGPKETPVWEHWEEFVEDYLTLGGSTMTIKSIRSFLAYLIRETEFVSIEMCNTPVKLARLLKQMKEERGFKNTTRNKYKTCLNTYFIWLEDMEYIEKNKVRMVRKGKEESTEVYSLSVEQIDEIFCYLYQTNQIPFVKRRNMLFFDLLRATGARRSELLALTPDDIFYQPKRGNRFATWVVRIHRAKQKGSIDYLALPDWAAESYRVYMEIRNKTRANEELLFCSQSKNDTGLTEKGVTYLLKQIENALGYKVTTRSFRTHVATRLMEENMSLQDISLYLGHKRISTTLRYIRKTPLMHRRCSNVMADQINEHTLGVTNYIPGSIT